MFDKSTLCNPYYSSSKVVGVYADATYFGNSNYSSEYFASQGINSIDVQFYLKDKVGNDSNKLKLTFMKPTVPYVAPVATVDTLAGQFVISGLNYTTVSMGNIKNYIGKTLTFKFHNPGTGAMTKVCADYTLVKTSGVSEVENYYSCKYNQSLLFSKSNVSGSISADLFPKDAGSADSMIADFAKEEVDHIVYEFFVQDDEGKQTNRLKFIITK